MDGVGTGSDQFWWLVARSSGITAWVLSAVAVLGGLALSTRALGSRPRAPWLRDTHQFVGVLTVVFSSVHVVALMLDDHVGFGLADVAVPMVSDWRPGAVAWGIAAFYLLIAVELTSLLRRRMKHVWRRRVHLLSYLMYAASTVHLITAGTDSANPGLMTAVVASIGLVIFFSIYRIAGPGRAVSARGGLERSAT